ncbi:hypothetical protein V5799_003403 [Amblyomma americanum]|uniref:Uncharacterized protein n=1 Tax=Amblyomma americanum TaxID=6943 RepID=A0AAQ4D924_AMBAM
MSGITAETVTLNNARNHFLCNEDGVITAYVPEKIDVNEHCAIFSFTRPGHGQKQCEMYVWHDTVSWTTPISCLRELDVVCEGLPKYQLYSSSCPW